LDNLASGVGAGYNWQFDLAGIMALYWGQAWLSEGWLEQRLTLAIAKSR
jgi:hypothetical protein